MGILKIIFSILIIFFPLAQIGRFQFQNGVAFSLNDILLIFLVIFWIGYHILNKKKPDRSNLTKSTFIFIGIAFVSLVLNLTNLSVVQFLISFFYLLRWILYVLLFFIVREFDDKFKSKIPYLLLFSGLLVTLGGYMQYFLYPNLRNLFYLGWDEHLYRMFSSFLDPNFAGTFFVLFFLLILGLNYDLFKRKLFLKSSVLGVLGFFVLIAIYLTYSRSALIMLILSTATFLFIIGKKKIIFISVLLLILIVFFVPKSFQTEGTNFLRIASSEARLDSAKTAMKIFEKSPIYGVGFNAYRYAQNKIGLNNEIWQITHSGAGTDNSFLFVMATTGIIGLLAYVYLLLNLFLLAKDNFKKNVFSIILFSSLTGLIFNSFFINSLFYVFVLEWIFILTSLIESK